MTDLSVTAANVVAGDGAVMETGTAGATITAGQLVYKDANGKYQLADNNSATAKARVPRGVALHGSLANQPLTIQRSGKITIGATVTAGVVYYASDTPGGICPVADLASGEYPCTVGMASSASQIDLEFQTAGVAL
jgi:hypothetical protein